MSALAGDRSTETPEDPATGAEEVFVFPASYAQQRLWFFDQLEPGSPLYNMPLALRLTGALEESALEWALGEIVRRHETLRTTFAVAAGEVVQVVVPPGPAESWTLPRVALEGLAPEQRRAAATGWLAEAAARPFDLLQGPLFRAALLRVSEREHILALCLHHAVADGWSLTILRRELAALYRARLATPAGVAGLPEPPIQYADFAVWQHRQLTAEVLERHLAWWRDRLRGAPRVLDIPLARPRPAVRSHRGGWRSLPLPAGLAAELKALCRCEGVTTFMALFAAFQVLLHRYTGRQDLTVGTPLAGRSQVETEGLIGLFVNLAPLRTDLAGDPTFREVLGRVRDGLLGAHLHQDLPFERLVEDLQPERSLSHAPLVQAIFTFQEGGAGREMELPRLRVETLPASTGTVKFDLGLSVEEAGEGWTARLDYAADLLDGTDAARLLEAYRVLLAAATAQPARPVGSLPVATEEGLHHLLREWNDPPGEPPRQATIPSLFAAQAAATPDAVAVEEEGRAWSYRELDESSNRLAHHLRRLGAGPEVRVGVCLNRSPEAVTAILAVLKAGGAYVPLEPAYPRERLAFMIADTAAPLLVTMSRHLDALPDFGGRRVEVVALDRDREEIERASAADPGVRVPPESLAYVVYTSGSTGRPKGVAVPHRAVARLVRGSGFAALTLRECWLQLAPIAFDASTLEIWGSLLNGARLVVFPSYAPSLAELGEAIERHGVSSLWLTAGLFHQMVDGALESLRGLRQLLAGGDVLSAPHVEKVLSRFPGLRLVNGYGPTENTTFTCCYGMQGPLRFAGPVPIGRPISGTRVVLLDARQQPVPQGAVGELYAGGEGMARGYLGRPELTAERFVPDPLANLWREPGARLYRTGDLARHLPDGGLEFLGRADQQVKIRGFRIEPGEIEAAIRAHPAVREATVVAREDVPGEKLLAAYVVPAVPADLRAHLAARLPDYMLPAAWVGLEALPLDANGKVDRRALPAPERRREEERWTAPRTPVEELLAGIWSDVLRVERIDVHDDFFDLGGHSLLATQVVSRLREICGVELPLRRLFEAPTVAGLARQVEAAQRAGEGVTAPPIVALPRRADPPASFAQERLWVLEQMGEGGAAYSVPVALRLHGGLDAAALGAALGEIVRRHEALRTSFRAEGPRVLQVVAPPLPPALPVVDLGGLPGGEAEARRRAREEAARPFDLRRGPLLRCRLLRLGGEDHILLLAMHHIVSDGWSLGVLLRELSALYEAFSAGRPSPLPLLPIQYADFAIWQREWLQGGTLETQLAFWRERLAGAPAVLELPLDRPRPAVQTSRGARLPLRLDERTGGDLAALCRRQGVTPFMALLAAFQALLARYDGRDDVPVGSPIANRNRGETEGLIGFFVNTLVLRTGLEGGPGFATLLERVREVTLGAYAHQDVPFEKLVEELRPQRAASHSPLFQVMLILQNAPLAPPSLPGLDVGVSELAEDLGAKFDLSLAFAGEGLSLRGQLEYNRDLFDPATAARIAGHFRTLLAAALAAPERQVAGLELLTPGERIQLLREWNDTAAPWPRDRCLHELVAAQAARTPRATAIVDGGSRLSYRELDRRANRLANRLRRLGVGPEARVGIALERSADLPVALLAVLKAGGAYVPLDPAYPRERLAFVLADAQEGQEAPVLLSERRVLSRLPPFAGAVVLLDEEGPALAAESDAAPEGGAGPGNLAYLIYTSGSTGRPKGVAIEHRSAVALLAWAASVFPPQDLQGVLASTSITFDLSVFELFLPLATGGAVLLADNALELPRLPAAGEVRLVNTVPSALAALVRAGDLPPGVRTVNLAGEPLKRALADQIYALPGVERVYNLYGPSEDTTYSTFVRVPRREAREPSIGVPVANTRAHVLDRFLWLLPAGVPGELCLGGEGLARGYLGRPELTAERFVPDPFGGPGERLYRTGDLARRRPDGELEFLGRLDHQVKIRGFRIELGEIEAALLAQAGVREAVVLAREDVPGEPRLVAYVAPELPAGLRERLCERLPDYMVPAAFVPLPGLPLTPNGKVDRKALPAPEWEKGAAGWTAPRTPAEELLAGIWSDVLRVGRIGVHDDFFELGGHSLLATQVMSRVREVCGVELPLRRLFEAPTVAELARRMETARRAAETGPPLVPVPRDPPPPASFGQERLWFLDRFGAGGAPYHLPQAFRMLGRLDAAALRAALDGLVSRHEVLRTAFTLAGQQVVQRVAPELRLPLPVVDLGPLPAPARAAEAAALARREASRPFDLSCLPLVHATLLRLAPEEHELLLTVHHIVSDGWSTGILLGELTELYSAAVAGRTPRLPGLPVQYADFAAWQREWLRGEVLERQLAFWREQLAGAPAVLELPTDRPRPAMLGVRGARRRFEIPAGIVDGLRGLCRRRGATLFMTVLAAFETLLARLTGGTDISVGSPIANRTRLETEGLIGLFINMLVLRTDLAGDPSFEDLLRRVRGATLEAYDHQDIPFEKLVEELRPQRDTAHTPLFQVMLILQNTVRQRLDLPGLEVAAREVDLGTAKFDLNVSLWEVDGEVGLVGTAEYNRDLFDPPTIDRLLAGFETLLGGIAADPCRPLSELPLLPQPAWQQVVREWNDTVLPYPRERCLHDLFEERAARSPEALAVIAGEERISYGELDRRANRLAWLLRSLGVGPGHLVAVFLDRGPEMVVAVFAVHKAGGAYVPVEVAWPPERVHGILADQGIAHLITRAAQCEAIDAMPPLPRLAAVVCLDRLAGSPPAGPAAVWWLDDLDRFSPERPPATAGPDDLAYIIFTSGSMGKPKGVVVRHRPAVNLVDWVNRTFGVGPGDRLLFITNLSFDLSVYDIFGILAAGGTLRIASPAEQRNAQALVSILCREAITFWDSAPAALQHLVPFFPRPGSLPDAPALRLVFLSGDWIPVTLPGQVRESFSRAKVISLGGATEATIWSNFYPVEDVDPAWVSIPYGRPIQNARYHVLGAAFGPCSIGVAGDLYIGGECLSSGYAGEPGMTAERYLPDPFAVEPGARIYSTGDRARHGPDGNLEFLGRVDTQVKVRGFRIELGEIEAVLGAHPAVREAVVLAREDTLGNQRLVAYLVPAAEPLPAALELRRLAQRKLPDYMVPSAFVWRESWPLSSTGKLDRKALPPPEVAGAALSEDSSYEPPRTELERTIAAVWNEVIGRERVSVRESFFDAGGHSLLMVRVHSRLQEVLGRSISLVDLFQFPTVESLARSLGPPEVAAAPLLDERPATASRLSAAVGPGMEIAVIGMAGRFPGAGGVEELWRNLRNGVESIRFFSDEELLAHGFPPRLLQDPRLVKARGALDGADLFDAAFFGYSPREAQIMDPQQRLFLECAWGAMEHAGYGSDGRRGRVGVYAGVTENTYVLSLLTHPDLVQSVGRQQISIANNHDYLPTRVSYKLNLQGPSINVQTACSTSLVAVHLACRSLFHGECEMAMAGGVSVQAREVSGYLHHEGGISSPDGHTRAFDAGARGVVGGSGMGVVVLKRLSDALADGDTVHAVIRGSASNNDGAAKVGFTAPSVEGQAAAIREALRVAEVDPATIDYVEAHGTGTPLGDPIEVAALIQAFGFPGEGQRCALGSIKTNIGHLDAASGVTGLIKTVLALRERTIPASLHFERPNPAIDFGPFFVNPRTSEWPASGDRPRRAAVSSFGIGGTNAHVVLEEAPARPASDPPRRPAHLLVLSAKTATALEAATTRLADHLEAHPGIGDREIADLAFTLQLGRQAFRHRRTLAVRDREDAVAVLRNLDPKRAPSGSPAGGERTLAFLFPGQGSQYVRMGESLYLGEPAFQIALDRCCDLLVPELGFDPRGVLYPPPGEEVEAERLLRQTAVTQPVLFAVEYALARLWMDWGVRPAAMIGHSIGEYVAACLAEVFSLEDGLRLVAARGRLIQELPTGAMAALPLPEEEVRGRLAGSPELALAAVNSPRSCVVSGPAAAVEELCGRLEREGLQVRRLHTSHAFHSAMMDPALDAFTRVLRSVDLRPPRLPYVSNLTGTWTTPQEATDPGYWTRHLREGVRFADGVGELLRRPGPILLEVGPGHTLATLARQCWSAGADQRASCPVLASLGRAREPRPDDSALLDALGRLWLEGVEVDWAAFHAGESRRRVPLPTYPFERARYWFDAPPERPAEAPQAAAPTPAGLGPIEGEVARVFQELLGVAAVGTHDDFFELGGSSLMAVQLCARLREVLGFELPADVLLEASTVQELAARVEASRSDGGPDGAALPGEPQRSSLVRLQAGAAGRRPLFMVHQVGGHVFTFRALARSMGADQPLYGLRSRGLEGDEEPLVRIEDMAARYLELVREVQPAGPYLVGGASMGGMVAFEMAHRLRAAGEVVALLALLDTPCREQMAPRPTGAGEFVAGVFAGRVALSRDELAGLDAEEMLVYATDKARASNPAAALDLDEARRLVRVLEANIGALYDYAPRPYPGRLLFFRARERRPADPPRPELPWIELAEEGVEILLVPGNHETMHAPPNVQVVAERLASSLARR